jgi:LmbE family N-acetylglucosaminyl deacetylase
MKILYIFPHPDDESYGPAGAMYHQIQQGHEVHLLTLTKGGATRMRHKMGLSIEEMGEVREKEMHQVAKILGLSSLTVWDWPDSGLQDIDPRNLERAIADFIRKLQPEILVSYPVHGISGFHDHLITHAVVKRVFLQLQDTGQDDYLRRLAFYTIKDHGQPTFADGFIRMRHSTAERIDCAVKLEEIDRAYNRKALLAYESYTEVIQESGILDKLDHTAYYEFYEEDFDPPLGDLTAELP